MESAEVDKAVGKKPEDTHGQLVEGKTSTHGKMNHDEGENKRKFQRSVAGDMI